MHNWRSWMYEPHWSKIGSSKAIVGECKYCDLSKVATGKGRMIWQFYILSFVFQSYQDDERTIVKTIDFWPTKWHTPVWSESLLCAQWVAKDPSFLHANSEDSDQTGWMPRLIWVFAGRKCHFVGFVIRWLMYRFQSCWMQRLSGWHSLSKDDFNRRDSEYQTLFVCFVSDFVIKSSVPSHAWWSNNAPFTLEKNLASNDRNFHSLQKISCFKCLFRRMSTY